MRQSSIATCFCTLSLSLSRFGFNSIRFKSFHYPLGSFDFIRFKHHIGYCCDVFVSVSIFSQSTSIILNESVNVFIVALFVDQIWNENLVTLSVLPRITLDSSQSVRFASIRSQSSNRSVYVIQCYSLTIPAHNLTHLQNEIRNNRFHGVSYLSLSLTSVIFFLFLFQFLVVPG